MSNWERAEVYVVEVVQVRYNSVPQILNNNININVSSIEGCKVFGGAKLQYFTFYYFTLTVDNA